MAEDNKKRRGRRAYLDDFQKTASGDYVYVGKSFAWRSQRKPALIRLWRCSAVSSAAALAAGCIPNVGMERGCAWVLLPYVGALIAAFSALWAVGRLSNGGDPVREYVYKATVKQLPVRTILTEIFSGVAILGEVVSFFLPSFTGKIPWGCLFIGLEGLTFAAAEVARRTTVRLEWGA